MKCSVDRCNREVFSSKMCKRHYTQIRIHKRILPEDRERERIAKPLMCTVEGCPNKNLAKGYCKKHYMQIYRNGELRNE